VEGSDPTPENAIAPSAEVPAASTTAQPVPGASIAIADEGLGEPQPKIQKTLESNGNGMEQDVEK